MMIMQLAKLLCFVVSIETCLKDVSIISFNIHKKRFARIYKIIR